VSRDACADGGVHALKPSAQSVYRADICRLSMPDAGDRFKRHIAVERHRHTGSRATLGGPSFECGVARVALRLTGGARMTMRGQGLRRLCIALGCSALAFAARLSLDALLGSTLPYAFALGGVALAVYLAGWRAAIVTTLVSPLWVNYGFIIPRFEFGNLNVVLVSALISYFAIAAVLIYFGARAAKAFDQETKAKQDMQRALQAADRANEAWRTADRQKDEFISVLSHELRNPLGAISNATLLLRERSRDSATSPVVDLLYRQVEQMRRLLDDLLDVARISRGLLEIQRETLDVRVCVQNAIDANAHLIGPARQTLEVVLPESPVMAFIDGPRITQIVSNLVNNSTKYAGDGARIEVGVEMRAGEVCIVVRDDGAGIDPALLPHLFERFHTNAKERSTHGLGLGLWISQWLASMHGGRIIASSAGVGHGVTFSLCIPGCEIAHPPREAERVGTAA
jgi:signal transduction histidine kinase